MDNDKDWFKEYQSLTDDEKQLYKKYILENEQNIIVSNYEQFKEKIEAIAENPNSLKPSKNFNIVEEIALNFDFSMYIAKGLKKDNYINEEIYEKLFQIDAQLNLLNNSPENWTIDAIKNNISWIKSREIANEIIKLLL